MEDFADTQGESSTRGSAALCFDPGEKVSYDIPVLRSEDKFRDGATRSTRAAPCISASSSRWDCSLPSTTKRFLLSSRHAKVVWVARVRATCLTDRKRASGLAYAPS